MAQISRERSQGTDPLVRTSSRRVLLLLLQLPLEHPQDCSQTSCERSRRNCFPSSPPTFLFVHSEALVGFGIRLGANSVYSKLNDEALRMKRRLSDSITRAEQVARREELETPSTADDVQCFDPEPAAFDATPTPFELELNSLEDVFDIGADTWDKIALTKAVSPPPTFSECFD